MSPGPKTAARIAGVVVIVALLLGGYYFYMVRPAPTSPEGQTVVVSASAPSHEAPKTVADDAPPPAASAPASAPPAAMADADPNANQRPGNPPMPVPSGAPSFDVVRVEPSGEGVLAGLSGPKATVQILDGSSAIADGEANDRGEWAIVLDKPLAPGTHDLSIRTVSADKKTETLSEQHVAIEIPQPGKGEPLVVLNDPNTASRVLQVPAKPEAPRMAAATPPGPADQPSPANPAMTDAAAPNLPPANGEAMAMAAPGPSTNNPPDGAAPTAAENATSAAAKPAILSPLTIDAVEFQDGKVYVAGSATMPGTIRVYMDGDALGDSERGANGRWLLERKHDMVPGRHLVRADQVQKPTGVVIARVEVPFEQMLNVAELSPITTEGGGASGADASGALPGPQNVIIRRGDNLWTISRRLYGHGVRFSTIYEANAEQIKDPDWIYPGQVFVLPAGDARWTN